MSWPWFHVGVVLAGFSWAVYKFGFTTGGREVLGFLFPTWLSFLRWAAACAVGLFVCWCLLELVYEAGFQGGRWAAQRAAATKEVRP